MTCSRSDGRQTQLLLQPSALRDDVADLATHPLCADEVSCKEEAKDGLEQLWDVEDFACCLLGVFIACVEGRNLGLSRRCKGVGVRVRR